MNPVLRAALRRYVGQPVVALVAVVVLFEEFVWDRLVEATAWAARLPAVARIEAAIRRLPPYPAMALFLVPAAALFPVKLAALWLMGVGKVKLGLAVMIAAELGGTAVVARLFTLCRPALLTVGWFAKGYAWAVAAKAWLYTALAAMPAWVAVRRVVGAVKGRLAALVRDLGARRG